MHSNCFIRWYRCMFYFVSDHFSVILTDSDLQLISDNENYCLMIDMFLNIIRLSFWVHFSCARHIPFILCCNSNSKLLSINLKCWNAIEVHLKWIDHCDGSNIELMVIKFQMNRNRNVRLTSRQSGWKATRTKRARQWARRRGRKPKLEIFWKEYEMIRASARKREDKRKVIENAARE